jgi:hypothetical protein
MSTATKSKSLSWKPVSNGAIYCAPACGCGCTLAAYRQAHQDARELCKRLGKGWKPRVWENMGWHYCAIGADGYLKVHPNKYSRKVESYTAFLATEPDSDGGKWAESGDTPEEAIANMLKVVIPHAQAMTAMLAALAGTNKA